MIRLFAALVLAILSNITIVLARDLAQTAPPVPERELFEGFDTLVDRPFVQFFWDEDAQKLDRRGYVLRDPFAASGALLLWRPAVNAEDTAGPINGEGTVFWRDPDYLTRGQGPIATYSGRIVNGRFHGHGTLVHRSGARYEGAWQDGKMHGSGRLHLPSGDEYVGEFSKGRRSGEGSYIDRFGNVFDGGFLAGLRDGQGTMFPADGRAYRAAWTEGRLDPKTRAFIPGEAGVAHLRPSQFQTWPDAQVSVAVLYHNLSVAAGSQPLQYVSASEGDTLFVYPGEQGLLNTIFARASLTETGRNIGLSERFEPVSIQFGLENRSTRPLRVVGAFLDVTSSRSELRPIFSLGVTNFGQECLPSSILSRFNCSSGHIQSFMRLFNYGWGPAASSRLTVSVNGPGGQPVAAPAVIDLPTIGKSREVDLSEYLMRLGLNVPGLRDFEYNCGGPPNCLAMARNSGAFGLLGPALTFEGRSYMVNLSGTLEYAWMDSSGQGQTATAPFETSISVGRAVTRELAEKGEDGLPERVRSEPFRLPLDQPHYRITLPISADVFAGRIANWTIRLETERSSTTEYRIVLQLSDGREVASRPIRMFYFLPNFWPDG